MREPPTPLFEELAKRLDVSCVAVDVPGANNTMHFKCLAVFPDNCTTEDVSYGMHILNRNGFYGQVDVRKGVWVIEFETWPVSISEEVLK